MISPNAPLPPSPVARSVSPALVQSQSGTYANGLSCRKCYLKHLSKASIELSEYLEDNTRYTEYSLCVGDIACAEDHARALGETKQADELRETRSMIMDAPSILHCVKLRDMSAAQMQKIIAEGMDEKARMMPVKKNGPMAARPPEEPARSPSAPKEPGSND